MERGIVVGLITSGPDPEEHGILSIAAVDFAKPERRFHMDNRLPKNAAVSDEELRKHGLTSREILSQSRPKLIETLRAFRQWTEVSEDHTIMGVNPRIKDFLDLSAKSFGAKWHSMFGENFDDLYTTARMISRLVGEKPRLKDGASDIDFDWVLRFVGLPAFIYPHTAKNGAELMAEAFGRLLRGRNHLEEFKEFPLPDYLHFQLVNRSHDFPPL